MVWILGEEMRAIRLADGKARVLSPDTMVTKLPEGTEIVLTVASCIAKAGDR
jgi:hypothetical protein